MCVAARSNAYMFGFFKNKRIVLFDTLIEQCQEGQVTAVIAHELAHWQLGHNWKNFVIMQAVAFGELSLFSLVQNSGELMASFGFVDERPALIKFLLFNYLIGPVDEVPFCCPLAPAWPSISSSAGLYCEGACHTLGDRRCYGSLQTHCPGDSSTRPTSLRCTWGKPKISREAC